MINYVLKMFSKLKFYNKKAFTLTEVLLAVMIVGILAMLVMPAVASFYQAKVFDHLQTRQLQALNNALGTLVINENKVKFSETIMNSSVAGTTDDTVGKFIKKYLRVAKYCGEPTGGKSDCFASKYYEYNGNDKKTVSTTVLGLDGACAQLKNGVSLCLTRQNGGDPARVVMDLNGPKGPNIIGRDFIAPQQLNFQSTKDVDRVADADGVLALDRPPLDAADYNPCASNADKSTACCSWRKTNGQITSPTHKCCENPSIKASTPACTTKVTLSVNYNTESISDLWMGGLLYVRPYLTASNYSVSPSNHELPSVPEFSVKIICDGVFEGTPTIGNSDFRNLFSSTTITKKYFSKRLRRSQSIYGRSCHYGQKPIYWSNGSKDITINGVQYHLSDY